MKTNKQNYVKVIFLVFLWCSTMLCAELMDTGFTYQGRLLDFDTQEPVTGECDLQFKLFDSSNPLTSNPIGLPITLEDVQVADGYFTTELNFGINAFNNGTTWLQVAVRSGESTNPDDFEALSPRHKIRKTAHWSMYASIVTGTVSTRWITETTDIDSYGTNWGVSQSQIGNWESVATTHEGKYQAAVNSNTGALYLSSDYGKTWEYSQSFEFAKAVAISADGKYITVVCHPGWIRASDDSGLSFGYYGPDDGTFTSVAMSADGQTQIAVDEDGTIWNSHCFGQWQSFTYGGTHNWQSVAMSMDGVYQIAVSSDGYRINSNDSGSNWQGFVNTRSFSSVAISADGIWTVVCDDEKNPNVWTQSLTLGVLHSDYIPNVRAVAISADGTVQTVVTGGGYIYVSTDSGENWADKGPYRNWRSVAMSADGAVQTVGIHQGNIWTSIAEPLVGIGTKTPTAALDVNGTVKATKFEGDGSGLTKVDWYNIDNIPAGFADDVDDGLTVETDPTVLASVKDGISWNEIADRPNGLDDGDDNTQLTEAQVDTYVANNGYLTTESDPQVGSNTTNKVPKWDGSALTAGTIFDNGNIGIGTESPTAMLDVNGTAKIATANILAWQKQSVSPNGYAWIGNILFQWGIEESAADTNERFSFPTAFPNGCFSVMINRQTSEARAPLCAHSFDETGFDIDRYDIIDGTHAFNYIAIGY